MKQLGLAMLNYHDEHRRFPPAAVCGAAGKPLLSWRVLILPYISHENLFKQFHLDEPWDSPHNIQLLPRMPSTYEPYKGEPSGTGMTYFRVFVGPGRPSKGRQA